MTTMVFAKKDLPQVLQSWASTYRLFGPVRQPHHVGFAAITADTRVELQVAPSTLSPKGLMLPQAETMFSFVTDPNAPNAGVLQEIKKDHPPRLLFGIRPCDARAFELLDLNFDTPEYKDPWWIQRRRQTKLVGLACPQPCATCFCTAVGGDPFGTDGLDLLLVDLGDRVLAQQVTAGGGELLAAAGIAAPAEDQDLALAAELAAAARQRLSPSISTAKLKGQDTGSLFNAPFWEEVQFACINCGVCTYVCPTCWCFDIQDEVRRQRGVRLRTWDACMFPLFTLHGSGHNPRSQKLQRVRQRFMHKLKYFVDKYDRGVACVGCGRCVTECPVNIDIRRVIQLMNDYEA